MESKICFSCKRNLPLFLFHVNDSKYQREADKGVVIECRLCTFKRIKKQNGIIMQRVDGKFVNVQVNNIKYFFKK
jgi:DNA-directed RNA polymerase subunit RPC12/RpoP